MAETALTFLGTGTSQGVPIIGCQCPVCFSDDPRDKRLRSSVMVEQGGVRIVIDTGPDFRQQMLREDIRWIDGVLYTHEHMDHVGGMDDVRAFNYVMGKPVDIWCEPRVEKLLRKNFDYAFAEEKYPGVPEVIIHTITDPEKSFFVKTMKVLPVRGLHYRLPVLGYKIGNLCYLTDINHIDSFQIEKIRGIDTLIINALRKAEHISHFSLEQALETIRRVKPRVAYLTHISHQMGFTRELEQELPESVYPAYDGLRIEA